MSCSSLTDLCEHPDCESYIPEDFCAALAETSIDECSFCGSGMYMEAAVQVSPDVNQDGRLGVNGSDVGIIVVSFIVIGMIIILLAMVIRRCALLNFHGNIGWQYNQISAEDEDTNNTKLCSTVSKTPALMDQV